MRATLLIFAALGLVAICLFVVIGTGLIHLSGLDPRPGGPAAGPASTQPDSDTEDGEGDAAAATEPTTGPAEPSGGPPTFADRSFFLSAADAKLVGPKIALFGRDNQMIRDASGNGPDPGPQEKPGKPGKPEKERKARRPYAPFIGRWADANDSAEWTFVSPAEGPCTVSLVYASPPGREASDGDAGPYALSVGGDPLVVSLKRTSKTGSFEMIDVGVLNLPKGEVHLTVRPQKKLTYKDAVHLRTVRLFPAG